MTNPAATETSKTYYTVTWLYPQGVELTSKEVFANMHDVKSYIGREIVGDDGTLDTRTFRVNTVTVTA
jgi:hypothetical protein